VFLVCVAMFSCVPAARADEAGKAVKAQQLLQLLQGDQMMKRLEPMLKAMSSRMEVPGATDEQRARIQETQRKVTALVTERIKKAMPELARIYADVYTEEELDGILAFYNSPVGKSFLQKMPEVMERSVPVSMQLNNDIVKELQPEMDKLSREAK
jgi:uncharacterized protein